MSVKVSIQTEAKIEIIGEEALLYLRGLTQNPHPDFIVAGKEDWDERKLRGELFEACDRALLALVLGDEESGIVPMPSTISLTLDDFKIGYEYIRCTHQSAERAKGAAREHARRYYPHIQAECVAYIEEKE